MDQLLHFGRKQRPELKPGDCISRYLVVKHSWRGHYRRIFCITPRAIITQSPDIRGLPITNSYEFCGDSDVESIVLGRTGGNEDLEFVITARHDKKTKYKTLRFTCKHRNLLLTDLYQCIAAATALGACSLATKVLGSSENFQAFIWQKETWEPTNLRLTAYSLESIDHITGVTTWRMDYWGANAPAVVCLAVETVDGVRRDGIFAVFTKAEKHPKVFQTRQRDTLLNHMQAAAAKRLGVNLKVDSQGSFTVAQLLGAVAAGEREQAVDPTEVPLGEWEVVRLRHRYDVMPPQLLLAHPVLQGRQTLGDNLTDEPIDPTEGAEGVSRRAVVTPTWLLERRIESYEVVERKSLAAVASVVRFLEQPKLLAVEWVDGAPPALYTTPSRDAFVACLLDAAQVASGRAIPVLPGFTAPGDVILSSFHLASRAPATEYDHDIEKMYMEELQTRGREAYTVLANAVAAHIHRPGSPDSASHLLDNSSPGGSPSRDAHRRGTRAAGPNDDVREMTEVLMDAVYEFNACVPYGGVSTSAHMEDHAVFALLGLLPAQIQPNNRILHLTPDDVKQAVAVLQCLQRLVSARAIATTLMSAPSAQGRLFAALCCGWDHIMCEAARLFTRMWAPAAARCGAYPWRMVRGATADDPSAAAAVNSMEDSSIAKAAKALAFGYPLQSVHTAALLAPLKQTEPPASEVAVMAVLEGLAAVACDPGARTSDPTLLKNLLLQCAELGGPFFALFGHPAGRVADGAAVMMRAIAECGANAAAPMREAALREGALLHHLYLGLYAPGPKGKLSRELVASWADEYPPALTLLRRIFPPGLVRFLNLPRFRKNPVKPSPPSMQQTPVSSPPTRPSTPPPSTPAPPSSTTPQASPRPTPNGTSASAESNQVAGGSGSGTGTGTEGEGVQSSASSASAGTKEGGASTSDVPTALTALYTQVTGGLRGNWEAFWNASSKDHCHAALVWNEGTRGELREALEREEMQLRARRARFGSGGAGTTAWNYLEFSVEYASLSRQLCIGGTYIKLLLEGVDQGVVEKLASPKDLFTALHHHYLTSASSELQLERWASLEPTPSPSESTPTPAIHPPSRAAFESDRKLLEIRQLCIRAMAAVYNVHAGAVGPVDGIAHLVKEADMTLSRPLRHSLLSLLQALIMPKSADTNQLAQRAAVTNGYALVDAGGADMAVDLVAGAHEYQERRRIANATPAATQLLTSVSYGDMPREWYYYPYGYTSDGIGQATTFPPGSEGEEAIQVDEMGRAGPVTKDEILQLLKKQLLGLSTPFWAGGMGIPRPLWDIRELRWLVSQGPAIFNGFQVAGKGLQLLRQLASLQPAVDERGQVLQPPPRVLRMLASPHCLPHVCQVMLTGEPELVEGAAALLCDVVEHNEEVLPRLYLSGAFYFALVYQGSNLTSIARLLHMSHLKQHFRGVGETMAGLPLAVRSYLGHLLPESLLYVLDTYGPGVFADALAGEHDTPELIWTAVMRQNRLVPALLSHLGDFPGRLAQHTRAVWDYSPLPPLTFPDLSGEIWCHRYYLRNLCDENRFKSWVVVDHVPFLQALLAEWRVELARKPLSMTEVEACQLLGLKPGPDGVVAELDMRSAYRSMARKYHPDKNPEGRSIFLQVQRAYERLQAGAAGGQGPQEWRLLLMLRAQCILFKNYSDVLQPFKYAGYPQLLEVLRPPSSDASKPAHFLADNRVRLVESTMDLCWLTCTCSRLNSEELLRCGGVPVLAELLSRCVSVMAPAAAPTEPAAVIATHTLRTFAGLAAVEAAREEMATVPGLLLDIIKCTALEKAAAAVDAALICVSHLVASPALQQLLLEAGVLGYLLPLLFQWDVTMKQEQIDSFALPFPPGQQAATFRILDSTLSRPNMSVAKSYHAILATQTLARLAGALPNPHNTPPSHATWQALQSFLTAALAVRIAESDPRPLLGLLNSSMETPQVIWNNSMREELLAAAEQQRLAPDISAAVGFGFAALRGELQIAGVFVRVFNSRPSSLQTDAATFCKALVRYLFDIVVDRCERGSNTTSLTPTERSDIVAVLKALQKLLELEPRVLGLLASKSALSPFISCLYPLATRGYQPNTDPLADGDGDVEGPVAGTTSRPLTPVVAPWPMSETRISGSGQGVVGVGATDEQFAEEALAVLSRITQSAQCVEALMEESSLRALFWMAFNPSSLFTLVAVLQLLHVLAGHQLAAWVAGCQAGSLYLLTVLMHSGPWPWPGGQAPSKEAESEARCAAAGLLGKLMVQAVHGQRTTLLLQKLLPPGLVDTIREGPPESVLRGLAESVETPECLWDPRMAAAAAAEVASLALSARQQQGSGTFEWSLPPGYSMQYDKLRGELYVGGVYVRLFLKNPKFPIRNPKRFVEGLVERYMQELGSEARPDTALLLSAAAVALLKVHGLLADHVAQLGYIQRLLVQLAGRKSRASSPGPEGDGSSHSVYNPPDDVGGSILRLLHQLAASQVGAESLATCTHVMAVHCLMDAMGWGHAAKLLVLETLKRALSISNRQRDLLVAQALQGGLVPMLLGILDWRQGGSAGEEAGRSTSPPLQQEAAVERALAVDVLQLMQQDGSSAAQVASLLEQSEVWRAYRDQRHDLFLPWGSSAEGGVVGLLTGADSATRYALPAPETIIAGPNMGMMDEE